MTFLLILLFCLPASADAEIYLWRDNNGNKHFSDRRHTSATKVDIKPGYSFYAVKKIFDGDTLVLNDGRKIRLLGINAPEVRHKNKLAEAGGEEAKHWLTRKLQGAKVRLESDIEKTDKYGRTLAHVFTEKKEHINRQLIEAGLATLSIYPPNLLYTDQLASAEQQAERARLGIWKKPDYAVIPADQLSDSGHPGWTRVEGRVIDIRSSRKFVYLKFSSRFEARIAKQWLILFPDIKSYLGKTIEVRGWLNKYKNGFSMLIRHPSAIHLR